MEQLLTSCAGESPPCTVTLPNVTAAFLSHGDFDGDGDNDLAAYIQAEPATTGTGERPGGTLVYLQVAAGGGLEVQRRHDGFDGVYVGGSAVDIVTGDFDGDALDDTALLCDDHIEIVRSCVGGGLWGTYPDGFKDSVALVKQRSLSRGRGTAASHRVKTRG